MKVLNTLIDGVGSIGWGIFLAVLITLFLYLIIYLYYAPSKKFSLLSLMIGCVLLIPLTFQCSLFVGSFKLKSVCEDVAVLIDGFVPSEGIVNRDNVKDAIAKATKQIPFVSNIVDPEDIEELKKGDSIGDAIMYKAYVYLNWYMVRRICWACLFLGIGLIGISYTMEISTRVHSRKQSFRLKRR